MMKQPCRYPPCPPGDDPDPNDPSFQPPGYGVPMSGSPINLYDSVSLGSSIGSSGSASKLSLTHPNAMPMMLHEVKFLAYSGSVSSAIGGAAISAQFTLGEAPITNGAIPFFMFEKAPYIGAEKLSFGAINSAYMAFRWKFDRPLFVPAGQSLLPTFTNNGLLVNDSFTVKISMAGTTLAKGYRPKKVYYPYISCFSSVPLDMTAASSDVSAESSLANMTDRQIAVTLTSNQADIYSALINIRMFAADGFPIVKQKVRFPNVFSPQDRAWEVNHVLSPLDYYRVYIDTDAPLGGVNAGTYAQAHVALHGFSEVVQ